MNRIEKLLLALVILLGCVGCAFIYNVYCFSTSDERLNSLLSQAANDERDHHSQSAEDHYREAVKLAEQCSNYLQLPRAISVSVNHCLKHGHLHEAELLLRKEMDHFSKVGKSGAGLSLDAGRQSVTGMLKLAQVLELEGKFDEAEQILRKAAFVNQACLGSNESTKDVRNELCMLLQKRGKATQSREIQLEDEATKCGDWSSPFHHGQDLFARHQISEARDSFDVSLINAKRISQIHESTYVEQSLQWLAMCDLVDNQVNSASERLSEALRLCDKEVERDLGWSQSKARCLALMAICDQVQNDDGAAGKAFKEALSLSPHHISVTLSSLFACCRNRNCREALMSVLAGAGKELRGNLPPRKAKEAAAKWAQQVECVGFLYDTQSRFKESESLYSLAMEVSVPLLGYKSERANVNLALALSRVYLNTDRKQKAVSYLEHVLTQVTRQEGPRSLLTAEITRALADAYAQIQAYRLAETTFNKALAIERSNPAYKSDLATTMSTLGAYYQNHRHDHIQAVKALKQALILYEQLEGPYGPTTNSTRVQIAYNLVWADQHAQARPYLERVLEVDEHEGWLFTRQAADARMCLGDVYSKAGSKDTALKLWQQAISFYERDLDLDKLASTCEGLGARCRAMNRLAEATDFDKKALAIYRRFAGPDSTEAFRAKRELAADFLTAQQFAQAEPLAREVVEHEQRQHPGSLQLADAYDLLALICDAQKRSMEADQLYRKALDVVVQRGEQESSSAITYMVHLAASCMRRNDLEGVQLYSKIISTCQKKDIRPSACATAMVEIAQVYQQQGHSEQAAKMLGQARQVVAEFPHDAPLYLRIHADYNFAKHRYEEAARLYEQLANSLEKAQGPNDVRVRTFRQVSGRAMDLAKQQAAHETSRNPT